MRTNKIFLLITVQLVLYSCQNKVDNINRDDEYAIIELDSLKYEREVNYSSIFKSVKILPLETNESCLIGNITQISFSENEIFILDMYISKTLFVFNKQGEFLRQIGEKGKGPGEYIQFSSFSIDTERQFVFALDNSSGKVIQYTFEGDFVNEFICLENSRPFQLAVNDGYIYIDHFPVQKGKKENLLKIYDYNGNLIDEHFLYPEYNHGFSESLIVGNAFSKTNTDIRYCKPFSDTIFSLKNHKLSPSFAFVPNKTLSKEEMKDINVNEDIKGGYFEYQDFKGANNYFECDSLILFNFMHKYSYNYLYWPKHNMIKVANRIIDDITFLDMPKPFVGCANNQLVSYANGEDITYLTNMIKSDSINVSETDINKIEKLTDYSNPVLLFYKCREKFDD